MRTTDGRAVYGRRIPAAEKRRILRRRIKALCLLLTALLLLLVLTAYEHHVRDRLPEESAAERWATEENGDAVQISVLFSQDTRVDTDAVAGFRYGIEKALTEASVRTNERRIYARAFADCYSTRGTASIRKENSSPLTVQAYGVGGDFYYFHPMEIVSGAFFTADDIMLDQAVLDENTAWQLFGSTDIAGRTIEIGGYPHVIAGVVRNSRSRISRRMDERSGAKECTVYISYDSLCRYGKPMQTEGSIGCYEAVLPEKVEGFGKDIVMKALALPAEQMIVTDVTRRYGAPSLFRHILDYGSARMGSVPVVVPYWEAQARSREDILQVVLLLKGICLTISLVCLAALAVSLYLRRKYTAADLWYMYSDYRYEKAAAAHIRRRRE